jgi:hypothetical protein
MRDDYKDYINKLTKEEQEWVKQFYKEWYYADFRKGQEPIITDPAMKAEANRNHNMRKTDIMEQESNVGEITKKHEFMEDASDAWEWQDFFNVFGAEEALHVINIQTFRDLTNKKIDPRITLNRYYEKRCALKKLIMKEYRRGKNK